ncbi:MAG: T9SS type A sorting domain-containing protein [Flavobacteriales bacterium]|nr:T9SS type A sorting domain-containing protein [Flavobacteriales bacterium]
MKDFFFLFFISLMVAGCGDDSKPANKKDEAKKLLAPAEWQLLMRSYPDKEFDIAAYRNANVDAHRRLMNVAGQRDEEEWTVEGPGNIGGRFNCIAIHPTNAEVMYAGAATGGIFKTTNGGDTWLPVFDDQPFLAIGAIAIDANNPNRIWAGTGDMNISGYCYVGDGIYVSDDAGATWTHKGLSEQYVISKILIAPNNSDVIYAGTMGNPFDRDENRGLYKSIDGGDTWSQTLFISDEAGVIDLVMNGAYPEILYAASYNRIRTNNEVVAEGTDCKIWKTIDGGTSWTQLTTGLPTGELSRIGLAVYQNDPDILYSVVADTSYYVQGVYRTIDGGENWSALNIENLDQSVYSGFGWYFGKIFINPENPYQIYLLGVDSYTTSDGGANWTLMAPPWWEYAVHADSHYMEFIDGDSFVLCTDGGIYRTDDNCTTWTDIDNIAVNQCYHTIEHPSSYGEYWTGVQDNGTSRGNNSTINNWERIYGGDGFQARIDGDNGIVYCETQYGGLAWAYEDEWWWEDFSTGLLPEDRFPWDMPLVMSAFDNQRMYCASQRVYKMENAPFGIWEPISDDLSDGLDEWFEYVHTIITLSESPLNPEILYAGTADGNVWVTTNGGNNWNNITDGLPERYVTQVMASPNDENTVYVTHSGYRDNENIPHIHMSTDNGGTWTNISGDLPQMAVNDVLVPAEMENVIFAATDDGVYYTQNSGNNWTRLGTNMPMMPVFDIEFNYDQSLIIASTFARSVQTIDVTALTTVGIAENENAGVSIYPNPASQFIHVESISSNSSYEIFTTSGKFVVKGQLDDNATIDARNFAEGTYFVVISQHGKTSVEKVVVMR